MNLVQLRVALQSPTNYIHAVVVGGLVGVVGQSEHTYKSGASGAWTGQVQVLVIGARAGSVKPQNVKRVNKCPLVAVVSPWTAGSARSPGGAKFLQ